jgi:tetratricopeptide (TPR) repeat protein
MGDSGHSVLGSAPVPGNRVGPYTLDAPIGSGGVASVFRARDDRGQVFAIKVLHPSRVIDEDVKRFTREYRALMRIDHPNVVRVYEAGVENGFPWLAMEYVDGTDLDALITRWSTEKPVDRFERSEKILRGLCAGLQYMHELGLVHRDLKPSNVLVGKDGLAKISDFGVVKDSANSSTNLTIAGRLVGTVAFMAPEQITGEKVDARADLYALGAVLYGMLTGRRPIEASSVAGYLARHLTEVPKAPGEVDPTVPPRLDRVCQRLLLKAPVQRYQSAAAVLEALDRPDHGTALPLRGRDAEVTELNQRLLTLANGAGGALAVIGAPGSGRTHLLAHFLELAKAQGIGVAAAQGGPDVVRTLLSALPETTDPGTGKTSPGERLERALRGKTWVVAVDDLDRAPAAEIESLGRALRHLVTHEGEAVLLLFVATSAEGPCAGLVDGTTTGLPADVVNLGPLDRKAALAMLRDRGLQGPPAAVLGRRLHDDHQGNPGAIVEQLQALVEAGWAEMAGDLVRPVRPVEDLRTLPLPVPARVRSGLQGTLEQVDPASRVLIDALAVLDRPAGGQLLAAIVGDASDPTRKLDRLVDDGLLQRRTEDEAEVYAFAHPSTATVLREAMPPEHLRAAHGAVAAALSRRRRREASLEVANHLLAAGNTVQAWPAFVAAARAAARASRFAEVFQIAAKARALEPYVASALPPDEVARHRRSLALVEGEARLARGEWAEAVPPLEEGVAAARAESDKAALARCLGSLGRAWYRQNRFDKARPLLEEALPGFDPGAPERASVTRALADILLRAGDVPAAERLWQQALTVAEQVASRDGEARARRGLAHVRVLQGRLDEAARLLDVAEDLLGSGGDDRVRAGVLARSVELDLAAGRLAAAVRRCEALLDLVVDKELPERLPEAWALCAEVRQALGQNDAAHEAVRQALTFEKASPDPDARIRVARVLVGLGEAKEALAALPRPEDVLADPIADPSGQVAAIRARVLAADQPETARDLATWVVVRPPPMLVLRAARIAVDASRALAAIGDVDGARSAAKRGLKALQGSGSDGLCVECLLALWSAAPDDRVLAAAGQLARRIVDGLPPAVGAAFARRPDVARALAVAS